MQANISITITREDILAFLRSRGFNVPQGTNFTMRDYDADMTVTFPLRAEVACESYEAGIPSMLFSRNYVFPPGQDALIRQAYAGCRKIEAIKMVRSLTGWGLKDSKDWVELNLGVGVNPF